MKAGKPKLAPKVRIPIKEKPFSLAFREKGKLSKGKSPMAPMTGKKLSK
jgi:hypothetical protein